METWFFAADCKHIPSSFVFQSTRHPQTVTVVGNGSKFLYFLDTKKKQQLAVLKFAVGVVHVSAYVSESQNVSEHQEHASLSSPTASTLHHPSGVTCGVCCLEDGRIVAINLEEALKAFNEKPCDKSHSRTDDIFASLLDSSSGEHTRKKNEALPGENVAVPIAACGDLQSWSLLCALVCNKKLIICKKSKTSGNTVLTIQTSIGQVKRGSISIPTFHGLPATQCVLSTSSLPSHPGHSPVCLKRLQYKPTLKIVRKEDMSTLFRRKDIVTIDSKLFLHLFGPEVELTNSSVLIAGTEHGHIFYFSLDCIVSGDREIKMAPLYSLDQPVIDVHASFFPRKPVATVDNFLMEDEDEVVRPKVVASGIPNALIMVGQRGKIAVCYVGDEDCIKFIEFHCPSPVLSVILVPQRCIVYSTLRGILRICLRQDCIEKLDDISSESRSLLIPEMSFKFPERIFPIVTNAILLETAHDYVESAEEAMETETSSDNSTARSSFQVTVMFFVGRIGNLTIDEGNKEPSFQDEHSADQELQKYLKSNEVTSKQTSIVNDKIATLNTRLAELSNVLTLLSDILTANKGESSACTMESRPFCCKLTPSFEDIGVSKRVPLVDVELSYNSSSIHKPLGKGWSLLVQSCNEAASELAGRVINSEVISLSGLAPRKSVKSRISVELTPDKPLLCSVNCILYYNATELCEGIMDSSSKSSKSTSILLLSKTLDALDFVQPLMPVPKELYFPLHQIMKSTTQTEEKKDHHVQQYTLELPFFTSCQERAQLPPIEEMSSVCDSLLKSLLPDGIISGASMKESIVLTAHDGSSLTLSVLPRQPHISVNAAGSASSDSQAGSLKVSIKSSSKAILLEAADCVSRRLKSNSTVEDSSLSLQRLSPDESFSRQAKLRQISQDVNLIFSELGKFDKERCRDNKSRQTKLTELESKTFKCHCQLQEIL